jgi:flagellar biogenesis protein FliO
MNRFFTLFLLVLCSSIAIAEDGLLGTKSDSGSALQGPASSGGSLLQMIIAVLVVFGLMKYFMPKLVAKFGGKLNTGIGSSIKIEESANFQGGTLYLVSVKDRSLLLGVAGTSITTLADLGHTNKPDPGPTFMEYLDVVDDSKAVNTAPIQEVEEPITHAVIESGSQAKDALERLQKLMR